MKINTEVFGATIPRALASARFSFHVHVNVGDTIWPEAELVVVQHGVDPFEACLLIERVSRDKVAAELGAALRGLVKGNGNYLERVIGAHLLTVSQLLAELAQIVRAGLSKRYYRHYLGFAGNNAHAKSRLPDEASNVAQLERWLVDVRLREAGS